MKSKLKYLSKYFSDVSKLIVGVGVVSKYFSTEKMDFAQFNLALLFGTLMFISGLILQPEE